MTAPTKLPRRIEGASFASRVILAVAVVAAAFALYKMAIVFIMLAGAIIVAVAIHLIADPLHARLRLPMRAAVPIAIVLIISAIGLIVSFFGVEISKQVSALADRLPAAIEDVREAVEGDPTGRAVSEMIDGGGATAGDVLRRMTSVAGNLFAAVIGVVVTLTAGIIFALYPSRYRDGVLLLFPKDRRARLRETANECGLALKGWLVGQLISMAIIGVLTSIGLLLIGMPSWLGLGLLAGLAQFVPIIGPNLVAIPGVVIGLSISLSMALWALAVYIGIQQLESNFITPVVMRKTASLPMALTILSIVAFTALFGLIGALVATPMTVAAKVFVEKLYIEDVLGETLENENGAAHQQRRRQKVRTDP